MHEQTHILYTVYLVLEHCIGPGNLSPGHYVYEISVNVMEGLF